MAFQPRTATSNNVNAAESNDSWKAQAFLNIYLPKGDGGRQKIGALPLKVAKKFEAAIIKRLSEDPDSLQGMVNKLEYEFNLVDDPKAEAPVLPW